MGYIACCLSLALTILSTPDVFVPNAEIPDETPQEVVSKAAYSDTINELEFREIFMSSHLQISTNTFITLVESGYISDVYAREGEKYLYAITFDEEKYRVRDENIRSILSANNINVIEIERQLEDMNGSDGEEEDDEDGPEENSSIYEDDSYVRAVAGVLYLLGWVSIFVLTIVFARTTSKNKLVIEGPAPHKEKHPKTGDDVPSVTFDDLQGCVELKRDVQNIINFLKNPNRCISMGGRIPKGIILYGPPGTGKTLTAKAIAGTAGVSFISASGSDFVEMYVGVGAKRIRELYANARKKSPCIVFIDEIDAVGSQRGRDVNGEREQTLNALLTELDGFNEQDTIFTICATNRLDLLDSALTRPGRFDRHIAVPLPDKDDRLAILKLHAKDKTLSEDVKLTDIAAKTTGFSGADLEGVLNEAVLIAIGRDLQYVNNQCIEDALFKILTKGDKKTNQSSRSQEELKLVAWHEAGHAVATKLFTDDAVPSVTIIASTSGAGGITFRQPKEGMQSKKYIEDTIRVMYAGRAAEMLYLGDDNDITTGACNDIQQATELIKNYIGVYGMGDLGLINLGAFGPHGIDSMITKATDLSERLYKETLDSLRDNLEILNAVALKLLDKETMTNDELDEAISEARKSL